MKYSIKSRNQRNRIDVITTVDNVMVHGNCVPNVFVSHYESFIGTDMVCEDLNISGLFNKQVSEISNANMIRSVTDDEIKRAMFDIGDDKAPGPDGYTSAFFKRGWDVVGLDVCNAICDFFDNGQIFKEINHTFLALIPKELMHNYHRNRGPPRCAFKVDIQKAYDTVDWRGNIHGFFKGKRGLRQGDPLSPYLFTLVMEILTLILKRRVRLSDTFRYHNHCEDLDIINVCFADDLFIFARGDVESVRAIMDSLDEFKHCELSVKYLGVPLISSRLLNKDCKVLVEKARNRIGDWKNKSLSFAGRLQLCKSDISSMQVYWAPVLVIPMGIISNIQQLIRGFLWYNGEYRRGKAKVAWDDICLPKHEGGLGLRSLEVFNLCLNDYSYMEYCLF
ncbi:hypothetical protein Tco_0847688 [Tanacetum coccineum]